MRPRELRSTDMQAVLAAGVKQMMAGEETCGALVAARQHCCRPLCAQCMPSSHVMSCTQCLPAEGSNLNERSVTRYVVKLQMVDIQRFLPIQSSTLPEHVIAPLQGWPKAHFSILHIQSIRLRASKVLFEVISPLALEFVHPSACVHTVYDYKLPPYQLCEVSRARGGRGGQFADALRCRRHYYITCHNSVPGRNFQGANSE